MIDIYPLALATLFRGLRRAVGPRGAQTDVRERAERVRACLARRRLSQRDRATLIAARGVQGIGAAAMFATTIALLGSSY